mgnify:CR=1 FL=1
MPCNDPDHMEAPVICDLCGRWVELDDVSFHVHCDCSGFGGCTHGCCPECAAKTQETEQRGEKR